MRRAPAGVALAAVALLLSVAPSGAQAPEVVPHEARTERRWDGEPYRLHRWRLPLSRTRVEVVDVRMRTRLWPWVRRGAALVINGGFYAPDRRPEGLVVSDGDELSPFVARLGGGVLTLANGRASQHDAEAPLSLPAPLDFAIQCRPRLVVGSVNNIARRTPATAARTALCVRDDGRTLDVYVARRDPSRGRAGPTLHTLAEVLVREGCEEALNLDGGPSTGVAWRSRRGVRELRPRRGVRHAIAFHVSPADSGH